MALPADLRDGGLFEIRLGLGEPELGNGGAAGGQDVPHDHVTIRARESAVIMLAPFPEQAVLSVVTLQADGVSLTHGVGVVLCEGDQPPDAPAPALIDVGLARTMAAFAPQLFQRGSRMLQEEAPHPRLTEFFIEVLMAPCTGFGADVAGARLGLGRGGGWLSGRSRRDYEGCVEEDEDEQGQGNCGNHQSGRSHGASRSMKRGPDTARQVETLRPGFRSH